MSAGNPDYGTIAFGDPPATAGDLRYEGVAVGSYTTVADASFDTGIAHKVATAVTAEEVEIFYSETDGGASAGTITQPNGAEFRAMLEFEPQTYSGAVGGVGIASLGGGLTTPPVLIEYRPAGDIRLKVTDRNGGTSATAWYAQSTYVKLQFTCRKYLDGSDTKIEAKLYFGATLKETLTHTIAGADKTLQHAGLSFGHAADSTKAAALNFYFGRYHVSWNNGSIMRNDQQLWTTWNPTVSTVDHPNADVTSPDQWTNDGGSATNLYDNINDDPFVQSTGDHVASTTALKELLMGWPNIGTLGQQPVLIINHQPLGTDVDDLIGSGPRSTIAKNSGGTYKRLAAIEQSTTGIATGVFITDPTGTGWTETLIDDADYGLEKPDTTASGARAPSVTQIWRYVLHGGTPPPMQPSLYRRASSVAPTAPDFAPSVDHTWVNLLAQPVVVPPGTRRIFIAS